MCQVFPHTFDDHIESKSKLPMKEYPEFLLKQDGPPIDPSLINT